MPPVQRPLANASVLGWRQKPQKTFDCAGRLSTDLRRVVPVVSWKAIGRVPRNFSGGGGQSCVVGYAVPRLAESPGVQAKPLFDARATSVSHVGNDTSSVAATIPRAPKNVSPTRAVASATITPKRTDNSRQKRSSPSCDSPGGKSRPTTE